LSKKPREVDYRSFLFLGISLISTGWILAIAINPVFISILASGLCIIAISLANKEKWNKTNRQNAYNNRGRSEMIK
jgi:hypothetical protein